MKVVINPQYEFLRDEIVRLPKHKYEPERVYCNKRNTVELIELRGHKYVLKRFCRPTFTNQFVYTFFRPNKAQRGYDYSFRLRKLGIETPTAVAYMVCYRFGIVRTCYLLSEWVPYPQIRELTHGDAAGEKSMIESLARFAAEMHSKGVLHRDFGCDNIMYHIDNGVYHFCVIDINRMKFGRLSRKECLLGVDRLDLGDAGRAYFMECYTRLRGWDDTGSVTE